MAQYPSGVKTFTAINDGDTVADEMWEDISAEVVALEDALLNGFEHNLIPESSGDARTLGSTSKFWGLSYLKGLTLTAATELTIATGAITCTQAVHTVDTEADAATDDLDTITAGSGVVNGSLLLLRAENVARVVTVKDGTGNLLLGGDFALSATDRQILLIYDGTNWREIARSTTSVNGITTSGSTVTQIAFAATQSASADANTLDDYEESTFTPTLVGSGGQSGQVYSVQVGAYIKIGKLVFIHGRLTMSTLGTVTGTPGIGGLPFTSENTTNLRSVIAIGAWNNFGSINSDVHGIVEPNTTVVSLYQRSNSTDTIALTSGNLTNTATLTFSGWYRATG